MLNDKKISFISCVSNQEMYNECLFYIDQLLVPDGFSVEAFGITDAESMTSGYQCGMSASDAKYKIYLHQDVLITNRNFIFDLLEIFNSNNKIGLVGMIGTTNLPEDDSIFSSWNAGAIHHNCRPSIMNFDVDCPDKYKMVEAVDGLILCTQVDIDWRNDLFDGWDLYDLSQCMELKRHGYLCATPVQSQPWVFHNNDYLKMSNYYKYHEIFITEYQDIKSFKPLSANNSKDTAFNELKEKSRLQIMSIVNSGKKGDLVTLFSNPESCGFLHLKTFETLSQIAKYQLQINKEPFWKDDSYDELAYKLQQVKFALYREQYGYENNLSELKSIYGEEILSIINRYNR